MDLRTITGPEAEKYRLDRGGYTHGRCALCQLVVAWRAAPGRRLKDHPRCPACDGLLLRAGWLWNAPRVRLERPRFGLGERVDGKALVDVHANAGGDLCADNGRGSCRVCGVALAWCESCDGVGYHRAACVELAGSQDGRADR